MIIMEFKKWGCSNDKRKLVINIAEDFAMKNNYNFIKDLHLYQFEYIFDTQCM